MIQVRLVHTVVKYADLDLPIGADSFDIKEAIDRLTLNDFIDTDAWQSVNVYNNGKDITGNIQPYTPHLNPTST